MEWPEDPDESFASASHPTGIYQIDRRLAQHIQLTADMIEMEQSKAIKVNTTHFPRLVISLSTRARQNRIASILCTNS